MNPVSYQRASYVFEAALLTVSVLGYFGVIPNIKIVAPTAIALSILAMGSRFKGDTRQCEKVRSIGTVALFVALGTLGLTGHLSFREVAAYSLIGFTAFKLFSNITKADEIYQKIKNFCPEMKHFRWSYLILITLVAINSLGLFGIIPHIPLSVTTATLAGLYVCCQLKWIRALESGSDYNRLGWDKIRKDVNTVKLFTALNLIASLAFAALGLTIPNPTLMGFCGVATVGSLQFIQEVVAPPKETLIKS
jgi:hypothetical protein